MENEDFKLEACSNMQRIILEAGPKARTYALVIMGEDGIVRMGHGGMQIIDGYMLIGCLYEIIRRVQTMMDKTAKEIVTHDESFKPITEVAQNGRGS